jgi:hypothetical protein
MAEVLGRLKSIEEMMWSLIPLKDQVAALEASLTEQMQQQQMLSAAFSTSSATSALTVAASCSPTAAAFQVTKIKNDEAFPTTHKMEFQKYDDVGDPLPWLNR